MNKFLFLLFFIPVLAFGQSVDGGLKTLTASGTDTYIITEPSPTSYDPKERFIVSFTNGCSSCSTATLNRSGLGAKAIKWAGGVALSTGDIVAGERKILSYNGTYYQITATKPTVITASGGLSMSGNDVELGGSDLILPTTIGGGNQDLSFGTLASGLNSLTFRSSAIDIGNVGSPPSVRWQIGTPFISAATFTGTQFFTPTTTRSGINIGSFAGDPSIAANGDLWYNSTTNKYRAKQNGSVVDVINSGITNSAASNELMKSDGTNAVSSGIFNPSTADLYMGTGKTGTNRIIQADGSGSDISLQIFAKGNGNITVGTFGNLNMAGVGTTGTTVGGSAISSGTPPDNSFKGTGVSGTATQAGRVVVVGGGSAITGIAGGDVYINGGTAVTGNANGGNINIYGGGKVGSGINGSVSIGFTNVGAINIGTSTSTIGFFGATAVVKQSAVTTSQGIADALAAYGLLPSSTISTNGTVTSVSITPGTNITQSGSPITGSGSITVNAIPTGSNTQIQYNNSGAFGASSNFTWNNSGQTLYIGNSTSTGLAILNDQIEHLNPGVNFGINIIDNPSGAGGQMTINAGNSTGSNGNGGDLILSAGGKNGSGINGNIYLNFVGSGGSALYFGSAAVAGDRLISIASSSTNAGVNFVMTKGSGTGTISGTLLSINSTNGLTLDVGGTLLLLNLPTSSAGLPSHAVYSNAGILTIVP